jgi:glycosyltransferase involved in cell wall biosynthesis
MKFMSISETLMPNIKPKMSIVTATYNSAETIEDTIQSVLSQDYPNLEYIIVDGASSDRTLSIIEKYSERISKIVSEPDMGLYDALNKGIALATGEIIGFLHSDDIYSGSGIITTVMKEFESKCVDSVFGDLIYVDRHNPNNIRRYYRANRITADSFAYGWMPPHPTFFVRRKIYELYSKFKSDYLIAADYELLVRLLSRHRVSFSYIPMVMVRMRQGGISTRNLKSNWILNREIMRACRENGIKTNYFMIYMKYLTKIFQLFKRPA